MKIKVSTNGTMRRNSLIRSIVPVVLGITFGLMINRYQGTITLSIDCITHYESKITPRELILHSEENKKSAVIKNITKIKPKETKFNYGSRPYFVYSELGFRYPLIIAIQTTEKHLLNYAVALNNTFIKESPQAVFFTPYSKGDDFHEKYNVKLNLNVIQLPDIIEGESSKEEFSFRIFQYVKDHYVNSYSWFMHVHDNVYVNPETVLHFLNPLNSSDDFYLGHSTTTDYYGKRLQYCHENTGVILSRTTLLKLPLITMKDKSDFGIAFGNFVFHHTGLQCEDGKEEFFNFVLKDSKSEERLKDIESVITYGPVSSPDEILKLQKSYLLKKLTQVYVEQSNLQNSITNLQIKLPTDVPERSLSWPIGLPKSFKPNSRFEVIEWTYFDSKHLYSFTDEEPTSNYTHAYRQDYNEIINAASKSLNVDVNQLTLVNGYRRLDPQRGAEYILDIEYDKKNIRRVHLLRPFSKVEALPMPAATEQKGIHIVLPVAREQIFLYESFLQTFQRICLQTGENVVLLTVFIHVKDSGNFQGDENEDVFKESKDLISRYKNRYMWAQLPWLQVGVKQPSSVLIMDIVSMKLPVNALIFFADLNAKFTTNFLNRCRVNVVNGMQVFFPIPFAEYDPEIVSKTRPAVSFVQVHRDNGYWMTSRSQLACFNNNDYKELRMHENNFLDENLTDDNDILSVFQLSSLQVFRAIESEVRHRFTIAGCKESCNRASRSQLAKYLFDKEMENIKMHNSTI